MANLAPELILAIIRLSDHSTQIKWCEATVGSALFHNAALHEAWHDLEVNVQDLIMDPAEDSEVNLHPDVVVQYKNNLSPLGKINAAVKYAKHIHRLDFNLCVDQVQTDSIPTYETAVYSAKLLMPAVAPHLREFSLDGPLCEQFTNAVQEFPRLRKLTIGRRKCTARLSESAAISFDGHWPREKANWTLLVLEEYKNFQFWDECYMNNYLTTTKRLTSMYLEVMKPYKNYHEYWGERLLRGPLMSVDLYFPWIFESSPGIKSIAMVDHWWSDQNSAYSWYTNTPSCMYNAVHLEELYIQSGFPWQPRYFLSAFPNSNLLTLRVSAACGAANSHDSMMILMNPYDEIDYLVKKHETTLTEVVFSDAWNAAEMVVERFTQNWSHMFAVTDLVLTLRCPISYEEGLAWVSTVRDLSEWLWGTSDESLRWGKDLERIVLHDSLVVLSRIDCLADGPLSKLRILTLSPDLQYAAKTHPDLFKNFSEERLVHSIAKQRPASLRYVSVGKASYWMSSKGPINLEAAGKTIKQELQSWLTPADREFLDPNSRWNSLCSPFRYSDKLVPDRAQVVQQNFLVARRSR